jgi:hypothetical protein
MPSTSLVPERRDVSQTVWSRIVVRTERGEVANELHAARRVKGLAVVGALVLVASACAGATGSRDRGEAGAAPGAPPSPQPPVRRVSFRLAVIGDFGTGEASEHLVARAIRRRGWSLDALVTTGDNIYDSGHPSEFQDAWTRPYGWVERAGVDVVASLGNHDIGTENGRPVMRLLGMPGRWYAETVGEATLFVLDANTPELDSQTEWLDTALEESSATWKIAVFHQPAFSCSFHDGDPTVQEMWVPLFERGGVDLVLSGHDHNYQRFAAHAGITYVVTGGGGNSSLYPLDDCPDGYPKRVAANDDVHHFVLIEGSRTRLRVRAIAGSGEVIDDFSLQADDDGRTPVD